MVSVAALDEAFQGKTTNTKGLVDLLGKKFHGDGDGSDSKIISFCELLINHKPPFVGMFDVEEISSNEAGNEASRSLPSAGGHCRRTGHAPWWNVVVDDRGPVIFRSLAACPPPVARLRLRTRKVLAWQHLDLDLAGLRKPASDSDRDLASIGLK